MTHEQIEELPPLPTEPVADSWWRHRKGGHYKVIAVGRAEATLDPVVIYVGGKYSYVWVRPHVEFMDGRFTPTGPTA